MSGGRRENAFMISMIGGVTLLMLAVTVFAVASQARSVSTQAETSVSLIEQLRVVSIGRAELSIASRVDAVDPDQTEVIAAALENARDAIDDAGESIGESGSAELIAAYDVFAEAADSQAALIAEPGTDPDLALIAELRTGESFEILGAELRAGQVLALDELRSDNDLMNLIGTIATFIVAFIVPSAALYVFEALRRTPRQTRLLEHEVQQLRLRSQTSGSATEAEVERLRSLLTPAMASADFDQATEVRRALLRLEHTAALNGSVRSFTAEPLNMFSVASDVVAEMSEDVVVSFRDAEYPAVVDADPNQLSLIIFELLLNALEYGAGPVRIEIETNEQSVQLSVVDRGPGLPDVVENAVMEGNDYAVRNNLVSGTYGFGLVVVQGAVETLGGTLSYYRSIGETTMVLEIPRSQARVATPGHDYLEAADRRPETESGDAAAPRAA